MSLSRSVLFAAALAFGAVGFGLAQSRVPQPAQPESGNGSHSRQDAFRPAVDYCASGLPVLSTWSFGGLAQTVKGMAKETNRYLENCHCPDAECVAEALDNLAGALQEIGPQLPPQVADLPTIVLEAARKVRAARTRAQVHAAIGAAIATLNAKIKLLTVDDPDARSDGVRSAKYVEGSLTVAEVALTRVSGL